MATVWLSYSWKDNVDRDVDFIAQQLQSRGLKVKLDRFSLVAGQRLWPQIEKFISDPSECDAWTIFITQNSLTSEAVKEEIAYALDRALKARGSAFPLIGINPGDVDSAEVPLSLSTRLYVSLLDDDWLERIVAGVSGSAPSIRMPEVIPAFFKTHVLDGKYVVEARPRGGRWYPGLILVPESEFTAIGSLMQAPAGAATVDGMIHSAEASINGDADGRSWKRHVVYHNKRRLTVCICLSVEKSALY